MKELFFHYISETELSMGKLIGNFKERISFIIYKTNEVGYSYIYSDNIGYIQTILSYCGSFTIEKLIESNLSIRARIVLHLYQNLLKSNSGAAGYHIFTEHYFTSIPLTDALLNMKCHIIGIIQTNRKFILNEM